MKIYLFYHSVISDWNHGNAHFLRGIISAFHKRNHYVNVFEPSGGWSLDNLLQYYGIDAVNEFRLKFPRHTSTFYNVDTFDPHAVLHDADVVIVHEWTDRKLKKKISDYRELHDHFTLFFHDTHHRAVTKPEEMAKIDLQHFDGVLVFGDVLRRIYKQRGWGHNIHTWHEAADTTVFKPLETTGKEGDLVWIGNWGDDERTEELMEFIIEPVKALNLKAVFYGVRYPEKAIKLLREANIEYRGWLPNYKVPEIFSRFRFTVHVPRRPYVENLPGIPTIRPFEAMACGIPLICSEWNDSENLFTAGKDYLQASNGNEIKAHIKTILSDNKTASEISKHALQTIQKRHTCEHRAEEFFSILEKTVKNRKPVDWKRPAGLGNKLKPDKKTKLYE